MSVPGFLQDLAYLNPIYDVYKAITYKPSPNQRDILTQELESGGEQTFGVGQNVFQQGLNDFGPSMKYFQDILSGNKAEMEAATGAEKSDILSQYRARRRQLARGQRGGGTNEAVASSEFEQAGDVAKLIQGLRPQAAKGSAEIAGQVAGLGLKESELGQASMFQALSEYLGARGQDVQLADSIIGALV
jgi:hypothetical protein